MQTLFLHQALEERKATIHAHEEKQRLTRRLTWRKRTPWKQIVDFFSFWFGATSLRSMFTFTPLVKQVAKVPVMPPSNRYITLRQYLEAHKPEGTK